MKTIELVITVELTPEEYHDHPVPKMPRVVMKFLGEKRVEGWDCQNAQFRFIFDANYNLYYCKLKFTPSK